MVRRSTRVERNQCRAAGPERNDEFMLPAGQSPAQFLRAYVELELKQVVAAGVRTWADAWTEIAGERAADRREERQANNREREIEERRKDEKKANAAAKGLFIYTSSASTAAYRRFLGTFAVSFHAVRSRGPCSPRVRAAPAACERFPGERVLLQFVWVLS